jgi:hypothetical protein
MNFIVKSFGARASICILMSSKLRRSMSPITNELIGGKSNETTT